MKRIAPKDRIIFALDVPSKDEAMRYARLLAPCAGVFKIGLELFTACGPDVVSSVKNAAPGSAIFLDMKFHDIPATVKGAMSSAASLGVDFVTVHCDEGSLLLRAAVGAAPTTRVLAVTVLTSLSEASLHEAGIDPRYSSVKDLVIHRAGIARIAGCAGVVCSGLEARAVREEFGDDLIIVTPGIRGKDDPVGDQLRVATPYEAVFNGADYIVVGRPIRNAADPVRAAKAIAEEIAQALKDRESV